MSSDLELTLWLPKDGLHVDLVELMVRSLVSSGFVYDDARHGGGRYSDDRETHEGRPVAEALNAWLTAKHWEISLWRSLLTGKEVCCTLGASRGNAQSEVSFDRVWLATYLGYETDRLLAQQFLGWAQLVTGLTPTHYGWGGNSEGLYDFEPIVDGALAELQPLPLEVLNIYGPSYIKRFGLDRLLATPAWRVEILANGCIALTFAAHPDEVDMKVVARAAAHLGVPGPPVRAERLSPTPTAREHARSTRAAASSRRPPTRTPPPPATSSTRSGG